MRAALRMAVLSTCVLLTPAALAGQPTVLSGTVRNAAGAPVPGAFVQVPLLNLSSAADANGAYRLTLPGVSTRLDRVRLHVRSIGYAAADSVIALRPGRVAVDFILLETALPLDDIVVSGTAGERERRAQPAAVATVDARAVVRQYGSTNMVEILQGRVPGLSVLPTALAGGASRLLSRGAGSVLLDWAPVVYVDGIRANGRIAGENAADGFGSSRLLDLNPEDIERIEVVRGPAGATLYGADASTGVIHVLTKRAHPGRRAFRQTISAQYGASSANWTPPANFGTCTTADVDPSSPAVLCHGLPPGAVVQDNPLVREDVLNRGTLHAINWSAQGGAEDYGFHISLGDEKENGVLPQNAFGRRSGRLNVQFVAGPTWIVDARVGFVRTLDRSPQNHDSGAGFLTGALFGSPLTVGSAADGWLSRYGNPDNLVEIEQSNVTQRITPVVELRHAPRSWFSHRVTLGADLAHSSGRLFYPKNSRNAFGSDARGNLDEGWIRELQLQHDIFTLDYLGTLRRSFGADRRFVSELAFGLQVIDTRTEMITATGAGLLTNSARDVSAALERSGEQGFQEERAGGLLAQWQGSDRNRRFLQIGARIDRNSRFGEDAEPFFLPKVGASWVISDEPFWAGLVPAIDALRVRAAWGTTGRSPQAGSALRTYSGSGYLTNDGRLAQGVYPLSPGNPDLRAERGREVEAGADLGFREHAAVRVTWFRKTTTDMLLTRPAPPSEGFRLNPIANLGGVVNEGIEVAVNARPVHQRAIEVHVDASLTKLRNEVTSLGGIPEFGQRFRYYRVGRPIAAVFSQRVLRVDADAGLAVVTDTAEYVGSTMPELEGTFGTEVLILRNLRVAGRFDWKARYWRFDLTGLERERTLGTDERSVLRDRLPIDERLRRFGPFVTASGQTVPAGNVDEPYLSRGDFLRWREASLTWDAPAAIVRRIGASAASAGVAVRNLALWSRYHGSDPEVVTWPGETGLGQSSILDYANLPQPRRVIFRLDVQF